MRQVRSAYICCTCVGQHCIEVVHSSCQMQQTAGMSGQRDDTMFIFTTPASAADTATPLTSIINSMQIPRNDKAELSNRQATSTHI